ncbi:hypothetical protein ACH6CV_16745 [Bacillota bacterium Meth-B3]
MRVKPIIFSPLEVLATLDDRKSQFRQVVKTKYSNTDLVMRTDKYGTRLIERQNDAPPDETIIDDQGRKVTRRHLVACREVDARYRPGDILWVRETWQEIFETEYNIQDPGNPFSARDMIKDFDALPKTCAGLSRECSCASMPARNKYYVYAATPPEYTTTSDGLYWKPSTQMPKAAARLFLRVTDVRVERLQDMRHDEAAKEGIRAFTDPQNGIVGFCWAEGVLNIYDMPKNPTRAFEILWDSINAKHGFGWDTNPWVWVVEFQQISKETAEQEGVA